MKTNEKMRRLVLTALVACGLVGASAQAQYLNTFDNTSAFTTGTRTYNPPPMWVGYDYGNATANSVAWSPLDDTGNGGGSLQLGWTWNYTANGAGAAAFTLDLLPSPGQSYVGGTLSFDLYLDPSSTPGGYNDYGYFQIVARNTDGYNFDDTGADNGLISFVGAVGQWTHVTVALNGTTGNLVRALTLQAYNDAGRSINGSET